MKLLKLVLSSIIVSCLASCGGGGGGSSTPPAVHSSIPSGAKISINPEIEFTSELTVGSPATAKYSNSDAGTFPVSSDEAVSVTMESTASTITISFKLASGEAIELIISDLTDLGEDGYYDEYTVDAKVDGTTVINARGYFPGTKKPRNLGVSSPVDINRAPTEEEFKKYLTDKVLHYQETEPDPNDMGYGLLYSNGTAIWYESEDDTDVDGPYNSSWTYDYDGGSPKLIIRDDWESNGKKHYSINTVKLNFTNFYEGTYESLTEEEDGVIKTDDDKGKWRILKSVPSGYVPER